MASNNLLVPPSQDPSHEKLWVETWRRIDRFLPELRKELALGGPADDALITNSSIGGARAGSIDEKTAPADIPVVGGKEKEKAPQDVEVDDDDVEEKGGEASG